MDGHHIVVSAYTQDFWKAFLERPKIFRWICKISMGQYAWSELIGAKIELETSDILYDYCLQNMEYHKVHKDYKDW